MIVQWCIKGIHLAGGDAEARAILDSPDGLMSAWVRREKSLRYAEIPPKLTRDNLNRHVNHFDEIDPTTGLPYRVNSPFVSLSAGTIQRDTAAQTNLVHRARWRALQFGLDFGQQSEAFLFTCWVVLAPRPAPDIEGVAEEIRDLNAYRRYSEYQCEGEVTAKLRVPPNQIKCYQRWTWSRPRKQLTAFPPVPNLTFRPPELLSNVRELI